MPKMARDAFHAYRHGIKTHAEKRNHRFVIARCQQVPIDEARVLDPVSAAPAAAIVIAGQFFEHVRRENGSVEFDGIRAAIRAMGEVALTHIGARQRFRVLIAPNIHIATLPIRSPGRDMRRRLAGVGSMPVAELANRFAHVADDSPCALRE